MRSNDLMPRSVGLSIVIALAFSGHIGHVAAVAGDIGQSAFSLQCGPDAPHEVFPVSFTKATDGATRITWYDNQGGYNTDIVSGSVSVLSMTHGDFTMATQRCARDNYPDSGYNGGWATWDDWIVPVAGEGYWYLLREDQYQGCPRGLGTYNSWHGSYQTGDRNTEIRMSGHDCTCTYSSDPNPSECTVWYDIP